MGVKFTLNTSSWDNSFETISCGWYIEQRWSLPLRDSDMLKSSYRCFCTREMGTRMFFKADWSLSTGWGGTGIWIFAGWLLARSAFCLFCAVLCWIHADGSFWLWCTWPHFWLWIGGLLTPVMSSISRCGIMITQSNTSSWIFYSATMYRCYLYDVWDVSHLVLLIDLYLYYCYYTDTCWHILIMIWYVFIKMWHISNKI